MAAGKWSIFQGECRAAGDGRGEVWYGRRDPVPAPARAVPQPPSSQKVRGEAWGGPACEGRVGRPPAHNASGLVRCFGGSRSPACLFQSVFHVGGGAGGLRACSRESAATRPWIPGSGGGARARVVVTRPDGSLPPHARESGVGLPGFRVHQGGVFASDLNSVPAVAFRSPASHRAGGGDQASSCKDLSLGETQGGNLFLRSFCQLTSLQSFVTVGFASECWSESSLTSDFWQISISCLGFCTFEMYISESKNI